ncbi:hypothetical protein D3C73_1478060 [compost metagenome]
MLPSTKGSMKISAFDEDDLERIRQAVQQELSGGMRTFRIPADRGDLTPFLYRIGDVVGQQYDEDNIIYSVDVNQGDFEKYGYMLAPFSIPGHENPLNP